MERLVEIVQSISQLKHVVAEALKQPRIGFDTETHHLRPEKDSFVVGWGIGWGNRSYYAPVRHARADGLLAFDYGDYINLNPEQTADVLRPLLEASGIDKEGMNLKHDVRHARKDGIELASPKDVQALIRLTHPGLMFMRGYGGGYQLKPLLERLLKWDVGERDELQRWLHASGLGKYDYYLAPVDIVARYMWLDVCGPLALRDLAEPILKRDDAKQRSRGTTGRRGLSFLWDMENELLRTLADIEDQGVPIDEEWLAHLDTSIPERIADIEKRIFEAVGREFDVGSNSELAHVLFKDAGIEPVRIGKPNKCWPKGQPSVAADVLATIDHPVVKLILQHRLESKLINTYVRGKKGFGPNIVDGRIHGFVRADGAATGRLSMAEPNLENLPTAKTDPDNRIRKLIVPDSDEYVLVSIDLSQIEPRLLAHYSGDVQLIRQFKAGVDGYRAFGSTALRKPPENITDKERKRIKAIVLGLMYGMGVNTLAKNLGVSEDEAKRLKYLIQRGGVAVFVDACYNQLRKSAGKGGRGVICTLLGRPRMIEKEAGHVGVNTVIQGGAAELFKLGMMRCHEFLKPYNSYVAVLVHDEIVFSMHKSELALVYDLVDIMTQFPEYNLSVPLECDVQFYADGAWGEGGEELSVDDLLEYEKRELFPDGIPLVEPGSAYYALWQRATAGREPGAPSRPCIDALYDLKRELGTA